MTLSKPLICVLFLISPFLLLAQDVLPSIGSTQILESAWLSPSYLQRQQELSFLNETKMVLPFLEELEFRTETQEFALDRQEYAMRLQINTPRQRKVASAVKQQEISLRSVAVNETLEQLLYERYKLVLKIALEQQQQQHLNKQQAWFSDQKTLLQRLFEQDGQSALEDLLKLEDKQLVFTKEQLENQQNLALLELELAGILTNASNTDPKVQTIDLPSPDQLADQLVINQSASITLPWEVQAQAVETELLKLEAAGELADQKNLLQFLQFRYTGDNDPLLQDRFTVGAGLRLPFRNTNSLKLQYLELEQLEEEHQRLELLAEWTTELAAAEAQFASDLMQYQDLQEELNKFQQQYGPVYLRDIGVTDIQVLLQAQGGIFHRQQLCLDQAELVYESYLEVLLLSGRLTQQPYRNWWSSEDIYLLN